MRFLPRKSGLLRRIVIRGALASLLFAFVILGLSSAPISEYWSYFLVSLVFSWVILAANEVNGRLVVRHLLDGGGARAGMSLALEIGSRAIASLVGSVIAALILRATIVPHFLGTAQDVTRMLVYSVIFTALFLGLIYAVQFRRKLMDQIRQEAEAKAREEQELRISAEIQRALLPQHARTSSHITAIAATIPCRTIGGDFFDYFDFPDGALGFTLADVAGKGPPAAIMAAMVQGILSSNVGPGERPAATLERVNRALFKRTLESRFATIFYGVLDRGGGLLACNAGHNPPFLIGADGSVRRLTIGGPLVGPFAEVRYEDETVALAPGATLVVFSDGVTDAEAPGGEQYGEDRLVASLDGASGAKPEEILERILTSIRSFASGHPLADDVTVLVVRYLGVG